MSTIAISAGRNIGSRPMSNTQWKRLQSDIKAALRSSNAEIFTWDALGYGEWTSDTGDVVREQSITYVGSVADSRISELEDTLSRIAREYLQDAIALIVGQSLLVKG